MLAVWWHRGPAEAPTAVQPPGRPMQYRTRDPLGKHRHIHICSLRPIRQWPCLTRSVPVADQVAAVALAAEGREAGGAGPGGPGGGMGGGPEGGGGGGLGGRGGA